MDFVHCNVCYVCPNSASTVSFFFSSCGHLFCSNCMKKGNEISSSRNSNFSDKNSFNCLVCSKPSSLLAINRDLRPEVQMYFRNARDLSVQYMQNLKSVIEFQGHHRDRLRKYVTQKSSKAVKFACAARAELEKYVEREKKMSAERDQLIKELERQAERSKIMEKMIVEKDAELHRLRNSSPMLDNSSTMEKTSPNNDPFHDLSGLSNRVSSRGSNSSLTSTSHSITTSKSSANHLSHKSDRCKHYSILSPSGSVTRSNSFSKPNISPSSKTSSRVQSSPPVFSTSFDGKFKMPKLVPLNSPRAFFNASGSSSYLSNVSPCKPSDNLMKATMIASYDSKSHLSQTTSSVSSNNSGASSVLMPGRIKKGSVISKNFN